MRYHEKLKKLDFRKVKNAIKKEQGVSITSQHNSSSLEDEPESIRSKYGNVLGELIL
jgi:DNA-directed RNA polymerase